jgi:Putative porin
MKVRAITVFLAAAQLLVSTQAAAEDERWTDGIKFKGDFRLRYEGIDEEFEAGRDRMRFRLRFGLSATVRDDVKVIVQIASGGNNPVSTNQTFDDGFSTKDLGLDLAYVDWKLNETLTINVGKMKNPLFKAGKVPLIWDNDLNPEGFAAKFSSGILFGTVAGFSVEERASTDDSFLYAVQGGVEFPFGDAGKLTAGIGYFAYTDTIGSQPFYNGKAKGNSVDLNGDYILAYKNTELFAQFDTKVSDWALQVFAHYTQNNAVSVQNTAYAFGARLGSAKKKGDLQFAWIYQNIEADSVIGTFNDSDFAGGGTDAMGHILRAKYGLSQKIFFGGSFFINDIDRFQGTEHDYNRVQVDLEFKFD